MRRLGFLLCTHIKRFLGLGEMLSFLLLSTDVCGGGVGLKGFQRRSGNWQLRVLCINPQDVSQLS